MKTIIMLANTCIIKFQQSIAFEKNDFQRHFFQIVNRAILMANISRETETERGEKQRQRQRERETETETERDRDREGQIDKQRQRWKSR